MRRCFSLFCAFSAAASAAPVAAQSYDENPFGRSLYVLGDLRMVGADGERSWLDGGFGKTRAGSDGNWHVRPRAVEGDVVWQPRLGWAVDATVAVIAQQGQENPVDLSEAYVSYRHDPIGKTRLSARVGLMWPPISLEHSGPAWSVTETITPSAINSWVGEELKVVAAEGSATLPVAGGKLTATAAIFGFNDTSGTLLSFRGWALHDVKATAFGHLPLPPLDAFMQDAQAPATRPVVELDDRPGFYAKLGWSTPSVKIQALYYDNRGDPTAVDAELQWGWRTRFVSLAGQIKPSSRLTVTAQAISGTTQMGYPMPDRLWVDTHYDSAFLLASARVGERSSISGRIETFGTRGDGSVLAQQTSEDGWAATLAGRHSFGDHVTLLAEVLHVDSRRNERTRVNLHSEQRQTTVQTSLRLAY